MLTPEELDALAEAVHADHIKRLDIPTEDLKPRPFQPRPRPNTALISEAVARVTIRKELARIRKPKTETV
jgi:hypothetical protein